MDIKKTAFVTLALGALTAGGPSRAGADQLDKRTYMTFSQPVSIPGKVLPAGTYTFRVVFAGTTAQPAHLELTVRW